MINAKQTNTSVIDIFSATKEYSEYFPDGVHPNTVGIKAIAEDQKERLNIHLDTSQEFHSAKKITP